jgi:tetratricopeptide (TPR) repeat protein
MINNAINEFSQAKKSDSSKASAFYNLAVVFRERNMQSEALNEIKKAMEIEPDNPEVVEIYRQFTQSEQKKEIEARLSQAEVYFERGMVENAVKEYEEIIQSSPDDYRAYYKLAEIYNNRSEDEKAEEYYRNALEKNPDWTDSHFKLGIIYYERNDLDKALQEFNDLIGKDYTNADAHYNAGNIYWLKGEIEQAVEELRTVISMDESHVEAFSRLGEILEAKQEYSEARTIYDKLLNLQPNNEQAKKFFDRMVREENNREIQDHLKAAHEFEATGDLENAMLKYQSIIEINPGYVEARYRLGKIYEIQEIYSKAFFEYERCLEIDEEKNFKEVNLKAGILAYKLSDYQKSVLYLEEAQKYYPNNIELKMRLIESYRELAFKEELKPEAVTALVAQYKQKSESNANNALSRFEYGYLLSVLPENAFSEINAKEKSMTEIEKACSLEPDNLLYKTVLAGVYSIAGLFDKSIAVYEIIISQEEDNLEARHKLAELYVNMREHRKASEQLKAILDYDSYDGKAAIGYIDAIYNDYNEADEKERKFYELKNKFKDEAERKAKDPMAYFLMGYAYMTLIPTLSMTQDDKVSAVSAFKMAISIDPDFAWSYFAMRRLYDREGLNSEEPDYNAAIEIAKRALERNPNMAQAHFELAEAYNENLRTNLKNDAIEEYKKAIALDNNHIEAHFKLASLFKTKNMLLDSMKEYNRVIELSPNSSYAKDARRSLIYIEKNITKRNIQ